MKFYIQVNFGSSVIEVLYVNFLFLLISGLIREPKWGHLKDLHKAIKLYEQAMVATDPTITSLGPNLEVKFY